MPTNDTSRNTAPTRPKLKISSGKSIVVLGAGIAGLRVVQKLQKQLPHGWHIVLVDKSPVHVFSPDLYQVASTFNPEISDECMTQLRDTVATPVSRLVNPWKVSFQRNEVTGVDPKRKVVFVKDGKPIHYDCLVVALGSVPNDFGIRGVKRHAYFLKTVHDALAINCHIDHIFQDQWKAKKEEKVIITVGGGGATGVELAGELVGTLKRLCEKYDRDPSLMRVRLIQAGNSLAGFNEKGTQMIVKELKKQNVKLRMESFITECSKDKVKIKGPEGEKTLQTDLMIWTAGVKVNPVVAQHLGRDELRGGIAVDDTLRALDHEDMFACGDNAPLADPREEGKYLPMMAQVAWNQADVVVENVLQWVKGTSNYSHYKVHMDLYVVPVGPHLTLFRAGSHIFNGFWVKLVKMVVSLKYSMAILPFRKAVQKWRQGNKIFVRNDV